jgi:type II secretion system protein N
MAGGGKKRWLSVLGYVLFGVAVFVIALAATFPVQPVLGRLTALASARTGWNVEVNAPRWVFPAGLSATGLTGTGPAGEQVSLGDVRLDLHPWSLKDGSVVVDHDVTAYGGRAVGHLEVENAFGDPGYRWRGDVKDVALSQLPPPPSTVTLAPWAQGYKMEGRLTVDGGAGWRGDDPARGQGEGHLAVEGLSLTLPHTPMGEMVLPFGQVAGEARWQRGRVEVTDVTIDGDLVRGRGSGLVLLGRTPEVSRLDLRFTGTLGAAFPMRDLVTQFLALKDDRVTITLKGTVARPLLFVNGKSVDRLLRGGT